MGEPKESIRRTQPDGIYTSYYLGDNKKVKFILTDVRYSRDKAGIDEEPLDMLGKGQWKWLESQFDDPGVELFLFGTGN